MQEGLERLARARIEVDPAHGEEGLPAKISSNAIDEHVGLEDRVVALQPDCHMRGCAWWGVDADEPGAFRAEEVRFLAQPRIDGRVGAADEEGHGTKA